MCMDLVSIETPEENIMVENIMEKVVIDFYQKIIFNFSFYSSMLTPYGLPVVFVIFMVVMPHTYNQNISMVGSGQDLEQDFLPLTRQTRDGGRIPGHTQVSRRITNE